jgi:general stress protein YciG
MADTSNRGFASMDDAKQRDIAAKGGASVPDEKRSFSKDHELAAEAGRKGGEHSHGGDASSGSQSGESTTADRANESKAGSKGSERGGATSGGKGGGNFAEDRERASEAGRKGGEHSHGGHR